MGAMGFGSLYSNSSLIFKRKFRWGLTLRVCNNELGEEFVKAAARPKMTIDETEINVRNGKMWIPGKAYWEQMTVTFYDVTYSGASIKESSAPILFGWLATIYDFRATADGQATGGLGGQLYMASSRGAGDANGGYAGVVDLRLYDGSGNNMELWHIGDAWPVSIDFGTLEYNSSDEVTIEATLRFADVNYTTYCGADPIVCQDAGCWQS